MVQKDIFQDISFVKINRIIIAIILCLIPNIVKAETYPGYLQLDYIESTGSQYIDTGHKVDLYRTRVELKTSNMTTNGFIFGSNEGSYTSKSYAWYHNTASNQNEWWGYNGNYNTGVKEGRSGEEVITKLEKWNSQYAIKFYGNGSIDPKNLVNVVSNRNLYIFGCNWNDQRVDQKTAFKLYYFKIEQYTYDTGDETTPIRNFIPVKRKSDNICGLYDTVGSKFYEDEAGVGFQCGEVIEEEGGNPDDPTPDPTSGVLSQFINIYVEKFQYLANGLVENEYLFSMVVVILAFIVLELFLKIFNIRRGGKR